METLNIKLGLTFDDILLLPGYTDFVRSQIDLTTRFTKKIELSLPLVSSPMDRVTESKLAIELARLGGIGIIHRNLSIKKQANEVKKVKSHNLIVGAAIGTGPNYEARVKALVDAKVDAIVIDCAHGFAKYIIEVVKSIKKQYPNLQVVAGNVATYDGAKALVEAGVDGLRVGMGPGAICSTRIISGMGVPQITALKDTLRAAKPKNIPVIADGGIRYSGDIVKALAIGASTVMLGSIFASAEESPGKTVILTRKEVPARFQSVFNIKSKSYKFKEYRGMGSVGAMTQGARIKSEEEFHGKDYKRHSVLVAEGVEGLVLVKGPLTDIVQQLTGGIRSGMYYVGAKNIRKLWQKANFIQITQSSLKESHPHDILITNPGENY